MSEAWKKSGSAKDWLNNNNIIANPEKITSKLTIYNNETKVQNMWSC